MIEFWIAKISPASSTRLAWSSHQNNKIQIVELESKKEIANFDEVKLRKATRIFKLKI